MPKLGYVPLRKPAIEASYRVAQRIAKLKKAHTIAEELVKPCALEMTELMCGKEVMTKLAQIPLSNNTILRRIGCVSDDIRELVCDKLRMSSAKASMQLDESTDVANLSQLLVYVRYVSGNRVEEEFLMCEPLVATTKLRDVKDKVDAFLVANSWNDHFGSLCTDAAPVMLGVRSGFTTLVKADAPDIISTHCALHREALAAKTLPCLFKEVLDVTVRVVNFIRAKSLNHRLLKLLAEELGAEHSIILLHAGTRCLSRGSCLDRVYELRKEIKTFLKEKEPSKLNECRLIDWFEDPQFISALAYLADVWRSECTQQIYAGLGGDSP